MSGVADLIGQSVWDCHGIWVGQVVDVRMLKERKARFRLRFRQRENSDVAGLIVSSTRAPLLLGLTRDPHGRLSGSAQFIARILCTGSKIVPWDAIVSSGDGEVLLCRPSRTFRRI